MDLTVRLSLFLCLAVAQSASGLKCISTNICALRGSTVDIRCIYRKPSAVKRSSVKTERIMWFTEVQVQEPLDLKEDPAYSGRVKYFCDPTTCTLRITALRESDSSVYKFAFRRSKKRSFSASPGVTLSVTNPDLQVHVIRSVFTHAELSCRGTCYLPQRPSYVWYKNGQRIQDETSASYRDYFEPADSVSCALSTQEDFPAPTVCVTSETCNRVTYSHRTICAFRGASVDISCNYSSHGDQVETKLWSCSGCLVRWPSPSLPEDLSEDSEYAGRLQVVETERGRSTLRITDLRESDSAEYRFTFTARGFEWRSDLPGTTLEVSGVQVQVNKVAVLPLSTDVELSCLFSCASSAHLSYVWFKNGQKTPQETARYRGYLQPGDNVSCALKGHEGYGSPAVYAPHFPSVSVSPPGEVIEGSTVTLTCSSSSVANVAARPTWYKSNLYPRQLKSAAELVFSSIQSSDSGHYYCAAQNQLGTRMTPHVIDVKYAPKFTSVSVWPSAEIAEGGPVTLSCSSDANPAANYTWYKGNQALFNGAIFNFTSIGSVDSGNYHCKSENQYGAANSTPVFLDVQYAPKPLSVSVSPSGKWRVVEGSPVTLGCSSDANPEANYTWYKEKEDSPQASGQSFTISHIRVEDGGYYYCEAWNTRGRQRATLYLLVVAGARRTITIEIAVTVFVLILVICVMCLLYRYRQNRGQSQVAGAEYQLLPSGRRYPVPNYSETLPKEFPYDCSSPLLRYACKLKSAEN